MISVPAQPLSAVTNPIAWEALTTAILMLFGVGAMVPLRQIMHRFRLGTAYLVFIIAASAYLAVAIFEPQRIRSQNDPFTWWFNRAVVGAMLFVAVRLIDRLVIVPMFTRGGSTQVPRFIHQVILIVLSIFVVLMYGKTAFGWPIGDFLTGGAVISIVIGLALQESLGNLFSGLMLQAAPPFVLGDFIAAGPLEGRVVDMTWRSVTLQTNDDNYVVIPNGTIAKQEIINFNAPNSVTARVIKIGLDYDLPPCDAIEVLQRAAHETPGVLIDPPPYALMLDFADSAIVYAIKFWIDQPHRHNKIEHAVRLHAWYRLKEKGFAIPYPVRVVEHVNQQTKQRRQHQTDLSARQAALAKVPLLQPLTPDQLRELADGTETLHLAPGQVLFHQDDIGDSFYVIRKGHADILMKTGDGTRSKVATLGPGDFFGEMSALTGQPRSTTVQAGSPLSLVAIDKPDLQRVIDLDPTILEKFSQIITRRNLHRDEHARTLQAASLTSEAIATQQQSLLGRMMNFFQKKQI